MADRDFGRPRQLIKNLRRGVSFNSDVIDLSAYNGCAIEVAVSNAIPASVTNTANCGVAATLVYGTNVTYTAVTPGAAGNAISVEYIDSIKASAIIQDLTYAADVAGSAGNTISVTYEEAQRAEGTVTILDFANLLTTTPDTITIGTTVFTAIAGASTPGVAEFTADVDNDTTAQSLADQINAHATAGAEVTATAVGPVVKIVYATVGVGGNTYALVYTDGDTNIGASVSGVTLTGGTGLVNGPTVSVAGTDITVIMESGVTTAAQIKAEIESTGDAAALVDVTVSGEGDDPQNAASATLLSGGLGGPAGFEEVVVSGTDIVVYIEDGVSTATDVAAAVNLSVPASALVTAVMTGGGGVANVTAQTPLAGGTDSEFDIATNKISIPTHGLLDGTPFQVTTTGLVLPTGLELSTTYYAIVVDVDTIKVASSFNNAMAGIAIDLTADGSESSVVTFTPVALNLAVKPQVSVSGTNFEDVGSSVNMSFTADGFDVVSISNLECPFLRLNCTFTAGVCDLEAFVFAKQ